MFTPDRVHRAIIIAVPAFFCVLLAATHDFSPDLLFRGSSLDGWHTLGSAQWEAADGEITASPNGAGGWLLLNKSYQDLEFYTDFRCTGICDAGVLFRAERTSDGGLKGVYVSLNPGDVDSWRVVVSPEGKIQSRTRLERSNVQFARIGTGAWTNGQAHVPGFSKLAPTLDEQKAESEAAAMHSTSNAAPARAGSSGRGAFPRAEIQTGQWNSVQVIVDADMVWITLNGRRSFPTGVTTDRMMGYGPIALYAGGSGEARFKDISLKDLNRNVEPAEKVSSHFRMQRLDDYFYSWGVTTGDINHDGVPDVIAGPLFFAGPEYTERRAFTSARTYSPANNFPQGMVYFASDFTGDGWTDILVVDSRPVYLYVNPKGEPRRWDRYNVVPTATSELELFRDIDGDGKPEVLFTGPGMVMAYAKPDPANPTGVWKVHNISAPGLAGPHGMGIGDIATT